MPGEDSGRPATDRDALIAQGGSGHRPAVVRRADHIVVGDEDVVEEHLVEVRVARDQAQRPHFDSGRVHVDHHGGDAGMLGRIGIGAYRRQPEIAVLGAGGPDLLAVDHPSAVDAGAPGLDRGGVGAGVGLAEQLAPHQLPHQRLLDPTLDLIRAWRTG